MLEARGIVAGYGGEPIVRGASVQVRRGELVTLMGPNGAGKSTLLKAIVGLLRVEAGDVLLDGASVRGLQPHRVVRRGVGFVPQLANVFPNLTVRENLELGLFAAAPGADAAQALDRAHALFPLLRERAAEKCGRLSGGQRQMVALGRALVQAPRVLLLDEPSAGLSPRLQGEVFALVRRVATEAAPVLMVEQNARRALAVSDRGVVLDRGENAAEGPAAELLARPDLAELYLGRA